MKTNLLLLCVALLAGCQSKEEMDFAEILGRLEIYQCDNGTYDVQTDHVKFETYKTLEEARLGKTNWAISMLQTQRRLRVQGPMEKCGRRVE